MQRDGSPGRKAGSSLRSPLCALGKRMQPMTLSPRSACAEGGRSAPARGANFSSKAALRTQTGRTKGDIAGRISERGGAPRNTARLAEGPQEPAGTGRTAPCAEDSWAEYAVCAQQSARGCGCRCWHTRAQRAHRCATPRLCMPHRCEVPVHSVSRARCRGGSGLPSDACISARQYDIRCPRAGRLWRCRHVWRRGWAGSACAGVARVGGRGHGLLCAGPGLDPAVAASVLCAFAHHAAARASGHRRRGALPCIMNMIICLYCARLLRCCV